MSEELKPCPFCGSEAGLSKGGRALCSNEGCIACGLFAQVEDWNRRAQPAEAEGCDVVAWAHPDYCDVITDSQVRATEWERLGLSPVPFVRQSDHLAALLAVTAERDALKAELALWEPIHYEVHRRAEKEWCLSSGCDFTVTVMHDDYAAIDAPLQES